MKKTLFVLLLFFVSFHIYGEEKPRITKYLEGTKVTDITGDEKGVWFATNGNGVYKYNTRSKKIINYSSTEGNLNFDFFYSIACDKKFVYAGSTDGLFILDKRRGKWSHRKFGKGGQLSNWIRSLLYDENDDVVWIGRFKYLTKYDKKKRRFTDYDLTVAGDNKSNMIKTVATDGDSLVWFGTEAGVHKYDKSRSIGQGSIRFYDNKLNYFNGEGESVSITSILFEDDNVWIGLDEFITPERPEFNLGGLYKFDRRNEWKKYDVTNGLPANGVYDIVRTGKYIWVSLYQFGESSKNQYGRGIVLINLLTEEVTPVLDEAIPNNVLSMYFDGESLWLGSDNGVYKLELDSELVKW